MKLKEIIVFLVIIFLITFGLLPSGQLYADTTVGTIEFSDCKVSDLSGKLKRKAECAVLKVPENYSEPEGKSIDLHIARFKAKDNKQRKHATTLLAGGPGQGAIETFVTSIPLLSTLNNFQDIYLIDQRGTGKSNQMQCDIENRDDVMNATEFDPELALDIAKECLAALPGDPRFYTTSVAMRDLDKVREKLGLQQWNLYGGSYGTRTAQHYLKQYPEQVRTVILDGLVSPDRPLGPEIALESQRSLDELLDSCAKDKGCNSSFPDLKQNVNTLIQNLKQNPVEVTVEDLATGRLEQMQFGIGHLGGAIRMALYSPITMSILPTMLHEAAVNNNYAPLARQALRTGRSLVNALSMGMHNSVVCTEDAPVANMLSINQEELENSYMGADFQSYLDAICSVWPQGPIDDGFHDLVETDTPVLLLSGSQDPVTPPEYADQAMQKMTNSKHIVVEGQGHIQMGVGCMPILLSEFIENESFSELETECLEKTIPEPFFLNVNGPYQEQEQE